jgi:hypothetical protein
VTDDGEGYLIETADSLPDPAAWDDVVRSSGAPVFYLSDVLLAYQAHPLQPALGVYYVTARSAGSGKLTAVLPAYLTPAADPLGIMPALVPGFRPGGRPLLLSHFWHWYDTHLPAHRLTRRLVTAMVGAVRNLAASCEAQAFALVNVPVNAPWTKSLGDCGLTGRLIDARYTLDLRPYQSADDYVGALPRDPRQECRRHLRRAGASDAKLAVEEATPGTLAAVARLCRHSAAKHGNADWYQPERLGAFLSAVGRHVLLITVRMNGELVAASVSFADGPRFHNWAAGSVSPRLLPFSPYLMLLYGSIDAALMERCQLLEGGRRNDSWKKRLGMRRHPLGGWAAAV